MTLQESVAEFIQQSQDYYRQWIFDEPIYVSSNQNMQYARLQKIMYKLVVRFVTHYDAYEKYMPISEEVKKQLSYWRERSYKPGTYRTDFVYNADNQAKIIEITCRFALNGIFSSALINHIGLTLSDRKIKSSIPYESIYNHLKSYLKGVDTIWVLQGRDTKNESKIYRGIFERMGYQVHALQYTADLNPVIRYTDRSLIISELAFDEILSLPTEIQQALPDTNILNDFRTVFLIHDKRFFSVIFNSSLMEDTLNEEEIGIMKKFLLPTYDFLHSQESWEEALKNKNEWIIKHRALGKSKSVYAGPVTSEDEWKHQFQSSDISNFVLQKWVPQKTITSTVNSQFIKDYITGSLIFFDNHYYGLTEFRTSSFPVTNVKDHRKACPVILQDEYQEKILSNKLIIY